MPTVLIIEDDQASRESFAMLIERRLGYEVVTAEGGEQALGLLRTGLTPGLIILDLSLPWMDGFTFREQQLADQRIANCPILVCSGRLDDAADLERLRGAAYLQKPIEPEVFLRFVRAFCQPAGA